MQRLRIKFRRGEELKFISHLDITRLWHRALTRAGIALAYSQGFSPHPKMSLAAPLAMGVTGEAELLDIVLARWLSPHSFASLVSQQLPPGMEIAQVYPIAETAPSLQSLVRFAEYRVELETRKGHGEIEAAISSLLAMTELPWQHQRDTGPHHYDLRALTDDIRVMEWHSGGCTLEMRLRCDGTGSGRPEQVAAALGFEQYPKSIHRTRLILETR